MMLLMAPGAAWAQSLTDDFPNAGVLTSNGWTQLGTIATNPVSTNPQNLTLSGLTTSGNSASLTTSGQDISRGYTAQTTGSLYASGLVNVSSAQSGGDYFIHFANTNTGTSGFSSRVFVKSVSGGIQFGLSKNGTSTVYAPTVYALNTTYFIAFKYAFNSVSTIDDISSLFVSPAVGGPEPSPSATEAGGADGTSFAAINLRQGAAASAPNVLVDYIRVGTTWADVTSGNAPATPTVTLAVSSNAGSEAAETSIIVTATATAAVTGDQTVSLAVTGTRITAGDFTLSNATITIPGGSTSGSVSFTVVDDADVEGTETATLTISNPSSGIALGAPASLSQTITITDNDSPPVPTVSIVATDATGAETPTDPITFTVTRTGDLTAPLEVTYTVGGTATNGTDYTTLTGTVTLTATQSSVDITLTPTDDAIVDANETIILTLTDGPTYDLGTASASATITDNDVVPATRIRAIQGTAHTSPLLGQTVTNVAGIVTARASNGFYMQDPDPDADDRTSEGIFVFTGSGTAPAASILVGDAVQVSGTVGEFGSGTNLTVTQIGSPTITELSAGQTLPTAIILGAGGRAIPTSVIEDDNFTSFDPATDGIDFYESVEGMRVQINNPVAVSPTITSGGGRGEVWVLADNGANATGRTARGGIVVSSGDFNPERIQIDDNLLNPPVAGFVTPSVNVGATFSTITGIVNYVAGNYEVLATTLPAVVTPSPLTKEITDLTGNASQLTVGTFNVENLDPGDATFGSIAGRIINNLRSPDILLLEEIQDNSGPTNNGVVDADVTFTTLINSITATGGPAYQYRQINPVNNQDGGEPSGNIRVGFLFNPARVTFVDRAGGTSTSATTVNNVGGQPQLSFSPGRVDPTNPAFSSSRKPLAGEFVFNGQTVFIIGNHFNSKGGDNPLFGNVQPPALGSETQRNQQATVVRNFVQSILSVNANANVIVAGDLNDFEFSAPLNTLKGAPLTALIETLPGNERYTYNFEGNAQTLDHILVSNNLTSSRLDGFDVVHFNSEFFDQDSDHDPSVARFNLALATTPLTLTFTANPTQILTTATTTLSAVVSGGTPAYMYTFSGPGTISQSPTSNTASVSGLSAGIQMFTVTVTDVTTPISQTISETVSVTVTNPAPVNQAPTTTGIAYQTATVNQGFSLNVASSFSDPNGDALTFVASGLPAGLSLSGSTISGTPPMSGVSSVTVTASDSGNLSVSTSFTIAVNPASATPPTSPFSITGVSTVSCTTISAGQRQLTFNPQYAGQNGQPISFSVVSEMLPTTNPGPYTLNPYIDNPTFTLKATQSGTAGEASFVYNWLESCNAGGTPPPPTSPFSITGVTTVSCTMISAGQRQIKFTPQYAGVSGQPISFSVVNEMLPTTNAGPYTLNPYIDNPTFILKATQSGTAGEVSFVYNWLSACNSSGARLGVEPIVGLEVRVIGNPTYNGQVVVEVAGASGQPLRIALTDLRGHVIDSRHIERAGSLEQHTFELGRQWAGLLLLRATTPAQSRTVKVIKVD